MASQLVGAVLSTVRREDLIPRGARVVCGFSGGPDSTALLRALLDGAAELDCRVTAAHLDHALRPGSTADAEACRAVAAEWGVDYRTGRVDWESQGGFPAANREARAREVRYRFLHRVAAETGAARIAVGHTADDRAETFLAQLVRGAGVRGLSLPRYLREDGVIRPLLDCSREDVLAFLAERGLRWREDPTNADGSNLRSRLRRDVLPALVRENPELLRSVGRTATQLADVEELLEAEAAAAAAALEIPGAPGEFCLDGPAGRTYHRIVLSCLLRKAARRLGQGETAGFDPLERCVSAWKRAERLIVDVPGGVRIAVEPDRVSLTRTGGAGPGPREREVPVPGRVLWSETEPAAERGAVELTVQAVEPPADPRGASGPWRAWIDADTVVSPLRVRGRRPGDRYRPLGLRGSVKVQDLFVDGKVPRPWRDALPLVVDGQGILWVPGFRVDHRGRITEKTRTALRLEITGHLPRVRESAG